MVIAVREPGQPWCRVGKSKPLDGVSTLTTRGSVSSQTLIVRKEGGALTNTLCEQYTLSAGGRYLP